MKQFTSTLSLLLLSIYVWAQAGTLETTTFNPTTGYVINNLSPTFDDYGNSMVIQSDGKIVVAVVSGDNKFKIVRYMPNGTLDGSFGTAGVVTLVVTGTTDACQSYAVGLQSNGKIIVGGYAWPNANKDFAIVRLNTDGSLDGTFGSGGKTITPISSDVSTSNGVDIIRSIAVLSDNSIIAAGYSFNGTDDDFVVAKYDATGNLVTGFGASSGFTVTDVNGEDIPNKVAITSTGAIVEVGTSNAGTDDYSIVRYTAAGLPDVSFNTTGKLTSGISGNDEGYGVAIQSNDYIVITGAAPAAFGTTDLLVARYKTDGTLDASFGTPATGIVKTNYGPGASFSNDEGHAITIQGDGAIVISGTTDGNGSYDVLLARYTSAGVLDGTFGTSATTGITTTSLSGQGDFGMDVALYGTNIYVAGDADYTTSGTRDFAIAAYSNSFNTLPVVLTQFYGQKQTSKVVLQWTTSSEENVAQYIVERSSDGKTYKAIGTVAATGNSSTPTSYSFADQSPFTATNNFYRLQVQDVNGSVTYSKILIIKFSTGLTTNMQLFPNPVKDILQIQLPGGFKGNTSLQVFDLSGHLLKMNSLTSDGNALNTTMDVTTLPTGIYTLKASDGNASTITMQFVKL